MRGNGFYWVRVNSFWYISEYYPEENKWYFCGSLKTFSDEDFDEIDENRILRTK